LLPTFLSRTLFGSIIVIQTVRKWWARQICAAIRHLANKPFRDVTRILFRCMPHPNGGLSPRSESTLPTQKRHLNRPIKRYKYISKTALLIEQINMLGITAQSTN
jgi:hypothetical protein